MTFDQKLAVEGAELISALYRGAINPNLIEVSTDTQVLIRKFDGRVQVIFPGTQTLRDWRTDLHATKTDWSGRGAVHSGAARAFRSIYPRFWDQLRAESGVEIYGHSLGGWLAMLAAEMLNENRLGMVRAVYTYGQPRIGNGSFTRAYNAALNESTFRIVNQDDPVPYLPPWLMGYRHAGREVFLNKAGGIEIERSLFSQAMTAAQAMQAGYQTQGASALMSVSAHGIGRYLQKLNEGTLDA